MKLTLSAYGHKTMEIEVNSYQHASAAFRVYIDSNYLGSKDLKTNSGVLKEKGKKIGEVAYNGRVFLNGNVEVIFHDIFDAEELCLG